MLFCCKGFLFEKEEGKVVVVTRPKNRSVEIYIQNFAVTRNAPP